MRMTTEEQIAHLLRRFGLGAGRREVEKYKALGVDGTLHKLVEYDATPDTFPVSVWEWHTDNKGVINPSAGATRAWWLMRMASTERPLEEKLTMFWHDHFAVSAGKVPAAEMDDYLVRLRANAVAPFHDTLKAISYSPAMVRWLDSLGSYPSRPNENFGREVMELFTLGIGHYTETDVRETARCFVGLGIQYAIPPGTKPGDYYEQAAKEGLPIVSVSVAPGFEDLREKTIRGKTGPLTAADVLKDLSDDPATADRVIGKLWRFFVSERPPSDSDREHLVKVWQRHDLQVRPVLHEMAKLRTFWDTETVRKLPKSPLDFSMGLARQVAIGPKYLKLRPPHAAPTDSIRQIAGGPYYAIAQAMAGQGLSLLYPDDVSGWRWGSAWLTTQAMFARERFVRQLFTSGWSDDYLAELHDGLRNLKSDQASARILQDLDVGATPEQQLVVTHTIEQLGQPGKAFADIATCRRTMVRIGDLLCNVPSFHLG